MHVFVCILLLTAPAHVSFRLLLHPLLINFGGGCCSCYSSSWYRGKTKSTPTPKTEVWTLDWSLTICVKRYTAMIAGVCIITINVTTYYVHYIVNTNYYTCILVTLWINQNFSIVIPFYMKLKQVLKKMK